MCLQIEIKRFLESVYGLKVEKVHTVSYEGKRKRRKQGFFREIDYKKVSSYSAAHMHSTTCAYDDEKASTAMPWLSWSWRVQQGSCQLSRTSTDREHMTCECCNARLYGCAGVCHSEASRREADRCLEHGGAAS